jgi:hypothetical protein
MSEIRRTQAKSLTGRIRQGDIIRYVEHIWGVQYDAGVFTIEKVTFPLVVVLTQDCDLEQDHHAREVRPSVHPDDKLLVSVLVAPLYNAEHVQSGDHLTELGRHMQALDRRQRDLLPKNQILRYHYLDFPEEFQLVPSVIDFKHYFSSSVEYLSRLRETNYACSLSELYREDVSQRFVSFLARIGLPDAGV